MQRPFIPARQLIWSAIISLLLILFVPFAARCWIQADTEDVIFRNTESIPKKRVGIVLGCARNLYFYSRIDAARALFKAGKIEYILVSGDNHTATYDEAGAMKESLLTLGIPEERIVCDYAGFSTLDSIVRAKAVFGLSDITIISQEFHVRRALFIAKRKGIAAIGFCADDIETTLSSPTLFRELFARVKTVIDLYLVHRQPVFLGDPILIDSEETQPALLENNKA